SHVSLFRKVLVANRGEIAVRVIRALREMQIASVAVFSEADRKAPHVWMADEAIAIGPAAATESYLAGERIVSAALRVGAEAIHPGYGFLSENAAFAKLCAEAGIKFIGPRPKAIEQMGSKTAALELAKQAGVPVVPGSEGAIGSETEARQVAARIGYPVLLKASAGGGGKGMRRVDREADLAAALRDARSEAQRAFGSGEMYLEKLIERPRHIEVQILGDEYGGDESGHLIHLGERECSIQRRHQKVVEECPSPLVLAKPELREKLGEAALKIARAVNYSNAGTIEFLAGPQGDFYFLEMNTRLQVEHPVTEYVTGVDLVRWQIHIAAGEPLTLRQQDIRWSGSAIECRVYAEDPENNFLPSPGEITHYTEPGGPGVRVDGGVYAGWTVPLEYDPLLAKLCVWGDTRSSAIERMRRALAEYRVLGITTNLRMFSRLMMDAAWRAGELHTGLLDEFQKRQPLQRPEQDALIAAMLAAAQAGREPGRSGSKDEQSAWQAEGRRGLLR
ncbi:MAG TPA: acetyl-CoA carboxylase biotin carboxylase subunit, partial [Chthoniobacterales bacterium]|nr:acetyl-CoA carboxylase biotin carboxylase subunit [Chthoniobacterales bacterium]